MILKSTLDAKNQQTTSNFHYHSDLELKKIKNTVKNLLIQF